jgi:hypothetical protein
VAAESGMPFIFAPSLTAVNWRLIRESNPTTLRNTTDKKMDDKQINEKQRAESNIPFNDLLFSTTLVHNEKPHKTR